MGSGFSREPLVPRKRPEDVNSRVQYKDRYDSAAAWVELLAGGRALLPWLAHHRHSRGELSSDIIDDLSRGPMCLMVSSI